MRHQDKNKILGRKSASRKALLRGLLTNFVLYEKIKTTETKAKVLKPLMEKYITVAKNGDLNARRQLKKFLYIDGAVEKMIKEIAPRYKDRKGGYTRIIKLNNRAGDGAKVVSLELV